MKSCCGGPWKKNTQHIKKKVGVDQRLDYIVIYILILIIYHKYNLKNKKLFFLSLKYSKSESKLINNKKNVLEIHKWYL